jgi:purine-binding chemotaxis protein CheW
MTDTEHSAARQLVVFALGSEHYALPIASVSEIIRATPPRRVTSDNAWIRGVIGLRGKIIPIFDLAARLGLPAEEPVEHGRIVIVDGATGPVGVMVDDVEEVLTLGAEHFEAVPSSTGAIIDAIARIGDRLVMVLDIAEVLDEHQPAAELVTH